jgi:hypothetical protein
MKAVVMITPLPKCLVMKKASFGTRIRLVRAAATGNNAPGEGLDHGRGKIIDKYHDIPSIDPSPITKIAEMRSPIRPS